MAGALSFNLATLSAALPLATGKDPHYRVRDTRTDAKSRIQATGEPRQMAILSD